MPVEAKDKPRPESPAASYYRARYYDPATGRFLIEDPIAFGSGIEFYNYAKGNPVRWIDPTGLIHQAWTERPFDGRLHDDTAGGLEVLCTDARNKERDIAWLQHSILVRSMEIDALGKDADSGHIGRRDDEIDTLKHCLECHEEKPEPEGNPITNWLEDRLREMKHWKPPQRTSPWGPIPYPIPIPVFP